MNLRSTILSAVLLYATSSIWGQSTSIQTDRPDQTESPFSVPKYYFQLESGVMYVRQNSSEETFYIPTTLVKYGLSERLEFRLITEILSHRLNGNVHTGLSPLTFGIKANLFHERGILPETSIIGHLSTASLGHAPFRSSFPSPQFRFTMQHTITENVILGYNLGAEWDGESARPTYIYTLTSGFNVYRDLSGFIEIYGSIPMESVSYHQFDGGFTFLINNDLQLDISSGMRITSLAPEFFISGGASYRFNCKRKNSKKSKNNDQFPDSN